VVVQDAHELAHPARVVGPGPGGHDHPVDHGVAVDELGPGLGHVGRQGRVRGGLAAVQDTRRGQHQRGVAQVGDRLGLAEEVAHDPLHVGVVADVLGARPPGITRAT
jgi:hypothetical protein